MPTFNSLYGFGILLFCSFLSDTQSQEFVYNGFNSSTNLVVDGGAFIEPTGALRLTNKSRHAIGHAFYPNPIPMLHNNSPNASSFSTCFVFQIVPSSISRGGYGIAFTLSPSPIFPDADSGHYMGVFSPSNDGRPSNHIFMVEFDTVNGYNQTADTSGNHIGININGMESIASKPASYHVEGTQGQEEEVRLEEDGQIQAWIEYDGIDKVVSVTLSPIGVAKPTKPLMSERIDLSPVVVENMYAGFSASTGNKSSSHYILGWSFRLEGTAEPLVLSQLPSVPVDNSSSTPSSSSKLRIDIIASSSAVLFVLLVALVGILVRRRLANPEVVEAWELECPHRFRYKDLHRATKGFKSSQIIGVGGFGAVYRGVLPSGTEIAVKKMISADPIQGMRDFAAEIESLGRLRHKNLVNLQGWCKHRNGILLVVYDYVRNGSLASLLHHPEKNQNAILTWEQRFHIVKGVALGLHYLHEEWEQVVIHRDVKSSNVLIDGEMNARLGDFGLARLCVRGRDTAATTTHTGTMTTHVVGTLGYLAPELTRRGQASTSSDVFAYGTLLLEVACGRRAIVCQADRNVILVDWVVEWMRRGDIFGAVDSRLESKYNPHEMELLLGLGLICSHPNPELRPNMRNVVRYLNGDEVLPVFKDLNNEDPGRRVQEMTDRLLALGVTDSSVIDTMSYQSRPSFGEISSASIGYGR